MSLFTVNRFTGEDKQGSQLSAEARLEQLKAEIAHRKQQRLQKKSTESATVERADSSPVQHADHEPSVKHKQKPKDISEDAVSLQKSGKVKRKKKTEKETDSGNVFSEDLDSEKAAGGEEESSVQDDGGELQSCDALGEFEGTEEEDPDGVGGFTILGNFENATPKAVKRVLPDWLAHPNIIQADLKRRKGVVSTDRTEWDNQDMKILDVDLRQKLHENDIHSFFPVQKQVIPVLMKDLRCGIFGGQCGMRPRDICVSAPTGSGKTLAFVLPIVQSLKNRTVPHVRAVVVLPVRDLAEQVFTVFRQYCAGTSLKVGLVVGRKTLAVEQATLVKKREGLYHSLVDIVVATPGRLVDHITSTPGFDLSHLRFLVIDEADRMMEDIKQDWLVTVEKAAFTAASSAYFPLSRSPPGPLTISSAQCSQLPLQKLLFSATLSHNPEKLQQLNLFMPRLLTSVVSDSHSSHKPETVETHDMEVDEIEDNATGKDQSLASDGFVGKYTTPEGLTEYFVECSTSEKPLVVLHFLHNLKFRHVLCFTNSVESTHRLYLLAKLVGGIKVREYSSRLQDERRKKIIRQFSSGKIDLLVCSDAMARGMDVENVKCVISYDNPPYIKTYIHRVGRTARAGKAGTSISLLEKKEIFHFKQMMRDAGKWSRIREMKVGRQALRPLVEPFQAALSQLPVLLKGEKKK